MAILVYIIAGLFLPLFPLSMPFNLLYARLRNPLLRGLLLLAWPQIGLLIASAVAKPIPGWIIAWALLTSLLYALRALALRELGLWTSFVGTSAWALLWILHDYDTGMQLLSYYALGISIPLALMAFLGAGLERRFGAAYLGLYGGLAESIPRFAAILVFVVLAIIATPLFPGFFAMLSIIIKSAPVMPLVAIGVSIVWMLWSWAGAKLIQGLIVGSQPSRAIDLSQGTLWIYSLTLVGLVVAGLYWSGAVS
jgi:NADH:ubiquinone oxidoreductase subunit 4 (subunit M)